MIDQDLQQLEQLANDLRVVPEGEPIYVVGWPDLLPTLQTMYHHSDGMHVASGAVLLQPELEAAERWRGSGQLISLRRPDVDMLTHELGHAACSGPPTIVSKAIAALAVERLIDRRGTDGRRRCQTISMARTPRAGAFTHLAARSVTWHGGFIGRPAYTSI